MTQPVETPPSAPETPPAEPEKAFTQADVDRIVADRVKRAKPADYEDLKAAAKKLADIEAANATDLEKAVAAAKRETEDAIRAEVRRERVLDRIEVLAAKDFADPEDARLRLGSRADEFVGKDGQVDAEEIAKALKALLEDKPHLKATQPRPFQNGADNGPRSSDGPTDPRSRDLQQIEADLRAASRR